MLQCSDLIIRPIEEKDIEDLYVYLNQKECVGNSRNFIIKSFSDLKQMFNDGQLWNENCKMFIILYQDNIIGNILISIVHPILNHIEIGFSIYEKKNRQKHFASKAVNLILDYLFSNFNHINRIQALSTKTNIPAIKVLTKCSFKKEGLLRNAIFFNNDYHDLVLYSVLREDFFIKL